ncbi:MAG: FAD-dependent oxidoreductase [Desulfobacterium sp.]
MKFVIIGGDAAGMSAASRTKRNRPEFEVIVLEQSQDVSYSACGMPYNIADPERSMEDLVVRRAEVFIEKNKINLLTGHRVTRIDRKAGKVIGVTQDNQAFTMAYDALFIATGARPHVPDVPGIDLPGVMPLKSLAHGKKIKVFIDTKRVKKAVISGMGYIGLEMCEALRARGIAVDMIKPGPIFLPWMTPELSQVVADEVTANGVNLYCGEGITAIESVDDGGLMVVGEHRKLPADLVISASGVTPCSELAVEAGLETGIAGAVAVDAMMRTSDDRIYAAGDCADAIHVVTGEKCWIPLALRANRAGWAVADNVCGKEIRLQGVVGTAVFKVFNMQVARTGLSLQEAREAGFDPAEVVIKSRSKAHSHPGSAMIHVSMVGDRKTGRLLGAQMVGTDGVAHRINAPAVALHAGMTVADFIQCDLGYAPPFGPVWDPVLTVANQLIKKL